MGCSASYGRQVTVAASFVGLAVLVSSASTVTDTSATVASTDDCLTCRPKALASVTFGKGTKEVHPIWDLEIRQADEVRKDVNASFHAVRTPSLMAAASIAALQLRLALAEASLPPAELEEVLDKNFKEYFDPETDDIKPAVKGATRDLMHLLRIILYPVRAAAASALSTAVLGCNASMVHCGVWDWYLRGPVEDMRHRRSGKALRTSAGKGDFFGGLHLDGKLMLGRKSRKADKAWGIGGNANESDGRSEAVAKNVTTAGPDWWNVWVLLSDTVDRDPLVLLDPSSWNLTGFLTARKGKDFVSPTRDRLADGTPFKFVSALSMRQGDALIFQSATVAHGSAFLTEASEDYQDAAIAVDEARGRISFDARCRCKPFSDALITTRSGEMCAAAWSLGGRIWHGCQPATAGVPHSWCAVRRSAMDTGFGCLLQDGSPCPHPCPRFNSCSKRYFDLCA